jgi:hypothetical protein
LSHEAAKTKNIPLKGMTAGYSAQGRKIFCSKIDAALVKRNKQLQAILLKANLLLNSTSCS